MEIKEKVSLKPYNTFGMDVTASLWAGVGSSGELKDVLSDRRFRDVPKLILGGGSNILFTKDFDGLVIHNNIPGISVTREHDETVLVSAGAGVTWHTLVNWAIGQGWGGIENLSLIPGKSGAAPIQNIGAYGVELKDSFHSLEAVEIETGESRSFSNAACEFGYRDSIFKRSHKGKYVITSITLTLRRHPVLHLSYGAIGQELEKMGVETPDVKTVSEAVCRIRRSKLPDPVEIGNAGSFFKNPEVSAATFDSLKHTYPGIIAYQLPDGNVKLAAGWLIEQCGWKGKRVGNTGAHKNQALVLVNYGGASGSEIADLAMRIRESVLTTFGVTIEPEVNIM